MKPDEMSQKTTPPRTEGSNPSLSATSQSPEIRDKRDKPLLSTTSPEGLGEFCLPLTRTEFVAQMVAGAPCEIPRRALFPWLGHIQGLCSTADIKVACDSKIAQLTPVKVILKQKGEAV